MDTNRGGWFADRQNSTGTSSCLNLITNYVLAAGLFVSVGTGVLADDLTRLRQERKHEPIISNSVKVYTAETSPQRTSAEDLAEIRKVFSPAMSDLAKSFNVSRQTIYNWLNGEQPTPEHTSRLRELALVADMFSHEGLPVNGFLLKRKVIKGKTLFELIGEGSSAQDTGQLLLQILRTEQTQRERLEARLSGRKRTQPSAGSGVAARDEA